MKDVPESEAATRAAFARMLDAWRAERRAEATHAMRGKTCPIQRPGLKR